MTMRICAGAAHVPGCHHETYMRQGVERFLAHPRTRDALTLALAQERPIHPERWAVRILVELARVSERLDGMDGDCGTPNVESVTGAELDDISAMVGEALAVAKVQTIAHALGVGEAYVADVLAADRDGVR